MAKLPSKAQRRNDFLVAKMQARAQVQVKAYLSDKAVVFDGDFERTMDAVTAAMMRMYVKGVCDALDVEDGKDLEQVRDA